MSASISNSSSEAQLCEGDSFDSTFNLLNYFDVDFENENEAKVLCDNEELGVTNENKVDEFESYVTDLSNQPTQPCFKPFLSSNKYKINESELSDEFIDGWKVFPFKLVELINGGDLVRLESYIKI